MILYLLVPVMILGNVESQTANMTELSKVEGNQTMNNGTMKPDNVTSSLYEDEKSLIEDELQNKTVPVIAEDEENFQDQEIEFPGRYCHKELLVGFSHDICGEHFHAEMTSISTEAWCVLENVIGPYNSMALCLEKLSTMVGCYYPNPSIQDIFLHIHSLYFHNCSTEEVQLVDAPQGLVVVLTLVPVSLIPVLVYLVVWKSNVRE